jgi:hypothetical protein
LLAIHGVTLQEWEVLKYFMNLPDKYTQGFKINSVIQKYGKYYENKVRFYRSEDFVPEKEVFIYIDVYKTMQDGI